MTEVRLITFRSAILERSVKISSCTPSVKNGLSGPRLRFSNGSPAMLFSVTATALGAAGDGGFLCDCAVHHQPIPMISNKTIAAGRNFRDVDFDCVWIFA